MPVSQSFNEAKDEIFTVFKAAWDPTGYRVVWPNLAGDKGPDQLADIPIGQEPWARVTLIHEAGSETIGRVNGQRRYERRGTIVVQIHAPAGTGTAVAYGLAKTVADGFEGVISGAGVWFRNVRVQEVGTDGNTYQVNVLANFTYDEIK